MNQTASPPAYVSVSRADERTTDGKWSVRRTLFFCLLVNGLFWGGLAYVLMRFFA